MIYRIVVTIIWIGMAACATAQDHPEWMQNRIKSYLSEPVANPPVRIYHVNYRDQPVYFIHGGCCDLYSELLDDRGELICHPDGGFSGAGDGKCPDFFNSFGQCSLIWQDPRGDEIWRQIDAVAGSASNLCTGKAAGE